MLNKTAQPSTEAFASDLEPLNFAHDASLMDLLDQSVALSSQLYAVFDVAKHGEFWSEWHVLANQYPDQWQYLYHNTPMAYLNDLSPLLIQVVEGGFGDVLLQSYLQSDNPDWGFLCVSTLELEPLLQHWQAWMSVYLPENSETLLRFYEPKILNLMFTHSSFDHEDRAKLLGPCLAIYLPQSNHKLFQRQVINHDLIDKIASNKQKLVDIKNVLPLAPWFYMDSEQIDAINHLFYQARLTELAVELYKLSPEQCQTLSHQATLTSIDRGIQLVAKLVPKASARSKEQFSLLRFLIGSEFYLHPKFKPLARYQPLTNALKQFHEHQAYCQEVREQYHNENWMALDAQDIAASLQHKERDDA